MIHNSDPDDDNGIADEGAKDKEDTSENPDDNSCDIVSIFRSTGDNIVECVDEDEDCGDEETKSGRVGSGGDEEADPGDDDKQGGGDVVHQQVLRGFPGEFKLEPSCREAFGQISM